MRWRRKREQVGSGDDLEPGVPIVAGYVDLQAIGRGATSTVYRARQEDYDRLVALKVLHVDVSDRRAQRRFGRERQLNGRLSHHPNVVTVLDSGFVDGRYPFLAMELLDHGSLSDRLASRGPFDVATTLHIGVRIAGALATAHGIGVLHRDVKPQNVLLSRYGEPALADFGIASLLEMEHSMTAGLTPVHAAPEILEGADPSAAADVYALGSTLYTLLASAPPFAGPPGEGMLAQLLRITTSDLPALPRDDVDASLFDALRRAMAKQPDDRPASAAAFGAELQGIQVQLGHPKTTLPVEDGDDLDAAPTTVEVTGPATTPSTPLDETIDRHPPAVARVVPVPPVAPQPVDMGHETVIARHQPSAPAAETRRGRRWPIAAGVVAVGAAAAGGWLLVGGDDESADPTTTPPASVVETVSATVADTESGADTVAADTVALDAFVPTDVRIAFQNDQVVVSWADQTDGVGQHLVVVRSADDAEARLPAPVAAGTSTYAVPDLATTAPACFQVRAVVDVTADGVRTADTEWRCINGATAVVPATSGP